MNEIIGMQPLIDMCALTLQSAYLKDEKNSVSLLIVAAPETCKTTTIMKFGKLDFVAYYDEITAKKMIDEFIPLVKTRGFKFLMIPDLINCTEKQKNTRDQFLNLIKTATDDTGITQIATAYKSLAYQDMVEGVKFGVISAITTNTFSAIKKSFINTGLMSRFVPFSYNYPASKFIAVMNCIDGHAATNIGIIPKINKKPTIITASPELLDKLQTYSVIIGESCGAFGIRAHVALTRLAKANALINYRDALTQEDIDKVIYLSNWINFKMNII